MQQVFAYVEGHPHVVHYGNVHDGCAGTYQFALFWEDFRHLSVFLCDEVCFVDVRFHFGYGSFGSIHQCGGGSLVLTFGTVLGHGVLCLGSLFGSQCGVSLGSDFVQLLCRYHSLVVQVLDAFVRLLGDGHSCLCFLPHFVGSLNLFLAGTFQRLFILCLCGSFGSTCLFQFGLHVGCFEYGQCVSCTDGLSFLDTEFQDTSGYLARHAVFGYFCLSLYDFRTFAQHKEANDGNNGNHSGQREECQQHIAVL